MAINVFDSYKDEELCLLLRKGERKILSYIFHKYYNDLLFFGLKIYKDRDLVEDMIQELFLVLWKNRKNIGSILSIKSYLLISLKRAILRKIKSNKLNESNLSYFLKSGDEFTFSHEDLTIQFEKYSQETELLIESINRLPNRQKEAIFLKYYEGLSYEEVEEVMSLNYQSVVNLIHKAIKNLRTSGVLNLLVKSN
jgi:RNA polymerase sigma factor (sigma-70 family)